MQTLGRELVAHRDEIVQAWYERWRSSSHPHHQVSERAIKDKLPVQLDVIGEELQRLSEAEDPDQMWTWPERLDPEDRVAEGVPIEDMIQGYKLVITTIRSFIRERGLEVDEDELSYLYEAVFELTAESARRYEAHRAEQVTKERSEYLAGIAHQMRTPLSALTLAASLLHHQTQGVADNEVTGRIDRNLRRLRLMVDGVLRLERFRPEDLPVRPVNVVPADLVNEALVDNESEALRKGIRLEAQVDRTLRMITDPDLLRDALDNLVDNAVRFTDAGSVRIELEAQGDGGGSDDVLVQVTDSGPGVAEERKAELFQPTLSERAGGAGIGLAVVHRAVTALGGTVGIESPEEGGARFWLRLPRESRARDGGTSAFGPAEPEKLQRQGNGAPARRRDGGPARP